MVERKKLKTCELNRKSVEEYKNSKKLPVVVVLDNVRSLNNIGSIFRTCDALSVDSIVLCGISATPPNNGIYKTALGAENSVKWSYFKNTIDAISNLKDNGFKIIALEQTTNSVSITDFLPAKTDKYALIFGNELKGVSQDVIDECDECIEIPQFGTKHSFNVSVTTAIVLWDFYSKINTMHQKK